MPRPFHKFFLCLTLALWFIPVAKAQVIFDSTFHQTGRTTYQYNLGTTEAYSHTVLADGAVLAAANEPGSYYAGYLARFGNDGSNAGEWTMNNCMARMVIHRLPGDTLVVAGQGFDATFNHDPGNQMITVTKRGPVGQPIAAFGNGGTVSFYMPLGMAWNGGHPTAVTVQPDGKIVVSITVNTFFPYSMVIRLLPDGQFDNSFGQGGVREILLGNCGFIINRIFPVAGGKMLVTGDYKTTGSTQHYSAFRLQPNGDYDSSYGTNGCVYTMVGYDGHVNGSAIQPDGKVVLAGAAGYGTWLQSAAIRYTADGALDNTFGTGGMFLSDYGNNGFHYAGAVERDSQGRFCLLGTFSPDGGQSWKWYLSRLKANGVPDTSFNGNAPFSFSLPSSTTRIRGLSLLPDGKIQVYGDYRNASFSWNLYLGRLLTRPWVANASGMSTYCAGDTATLICHSSGQPQWYRDAVLLPVTGKTIRVTAGGTYLAVVQSGNSSDTSNPVTLTFHPLPQPVILVSGDSLVVTGSGSFTWHRAADSSVVAGASGNSFHPGSGGYFVRQTDSNGCAGSSAVVYFTAAGIGSAGMVAGPVTFWPNPVAGELHLRNEGREAYELGISLVTGQVLARYRVESGTQVIDLKRLSLPAGSLLILQFSGEGMRFVRRVQVR